MGIPRYAGAEIRKRNAFSSLEGDSPPKPPRTKCGKEKNTKEKIPPI